MLHADLLRGAALRPPVFVHRIAVHLYHFVVILGWDAAMSNRRTTRRGHDPDAASRLANGLVEYRALFISPLPQRR